MRIVKGVLILFGVVLAIAAFYPFRTTVAPLWRVRFVDDAKSPLRNATVKEVWKHYSLESQSHEQDLSTDNEGYVTFPERTIRAGAAVRLIGSAIAGLNPHGSTGPLAYLIILTPGYETWSNNSYTPGQPLPKEIIVKRNR